MGVDDWSCCGTARAPGTSRTCSRAGTTSTCRPQGRSRRSQAGRLIKAAGIAFDSCFTSVLKRAIRTLWIVLDELDHMWLPVERSWRLNERHYGALQGLDKAQTVERARRRAGEDLAPQLRHPAAAACRATTRAIRASIAATPRLPRGAAAPPNR